MFKARLSRWQRKTSLSGEGAVELGCAYNLNSHLLTEAEREVVIALTGGATYAVIAPERGTAGRTSADQAQAISRQPGVSSFVEPVRHLVPLNDAT